MAILAVFHFFTNGGIKALLPDKTVAIGIAFDHPFGSSSWLQTNKYRKAKKGNAGTIEEIQRTK